MLKETMITQKRPDEPALDYGLLRSEGLAHIERLGSRIWTDFNLSDPGITVLEILCFALTDLAYRTAWPVEDILSDRGGDLHDQFLTALEILPSGAVTMNDYRKLLIDIEGVRNGWFVKADLEPYYADCLSSSLVKTPSAGHPSREIRLRGIYDVLLELDDALSDDDQAKAIATARERLHANRNLCEDFREVRTVGTDAFIVCAEIDLDPEADPTETEAKIFLEISNYFAPEIPFRSLQEMLDRGTTTEAIFNGPALDHGFIADEELEASSLRESIRLSDIISIVMDIEGVRGVRDILIAPASGIEEGADKWLLPVKKSSRPLLDTTLSRIVFFKDILPFMPDTAKAEDRYRELQKEQRQANESVMTEDLPLPWGKKRSAGSYYSFQNHFPLCYGIGEAGLPEIATDERKAQAKQLKAYLLFFDQLLADYLSQLSHLRDLFSLDDDIGRTYFTQVVSSVKDGRELFRDFSGIGTVLDGLAENRELFLQRRNRFLDHLLSRFAEEFSDYAWLLYSQGCNQTPGEIIRAKTAFLRDYKGISSGRALGFNYSDPEWIWDTDNVTGLEKRVARLTGMRNFFRRNLFDVAYDIYNEKDSDGETEYRFRVVDDKGKILLSSSTRYGTKKAAAAEMRLTLDRAMIRDGYELKQTSDGRYYFNIINNKGEIIARRIEYFSSEADREAAILYLTDFIAGKYSDEGMFVVEHILLRPKADADGFLPICLEPGCPAPEEADPYSFRISIILPAWSARFSAMPFRKFVEKTLREECPSHILSRICWVGQGQMEEFEGLYQRWLRFNAGEGEENCLNELLDCLSRMRNDYPEARLSDCKPEGFGSTPFVLGDTNI